MNNGVNNNINSSQPNGGVNQPVGNNVPLNTNNNVAPVMSAPVMQTNPGVTANPSVISSPSAPSNDGVVNPAPVANAQPEIAPVVENNQTPAEQTNTNDTSNSPNLGYVIAPPSDNAEAQQEAVEEKKLAKKVEEDALKIKELEEENKKLKEEVTSSNGTGTTTTSKKRGGGKIAGFLFLIIIVMGVYIAFSTKDHQTQIQSIKYNCTPVTASEKTTKLDINSVLVQNLYDKVSTNIKEDLAEPEFNNSMKMYLAYRLISESSKYESNCSLFDQTAIEPFVCDDNNNYFTPHAFKPEKLKNAFVSLFGEDTPFAYSHIQLGNSCFGGYQYIEQRNEYVEGMCTKSSTTTYKVTKELKEATSSRNTIVLKEEVKYTQPDGGKIPPYLKSGYYLYTFRLDLNYNFIFVSKVYQQKYQ